MKDRKSIRMPAFDYSSENSYFVTICTYMKYPFLGKIANNDMSLSDTGTIVSDCWNNIGKLYSGISTGQFIVMPNHIHGVIHISPSNIQTDSMLTHGLSDIIRNYKAFTSHVVYSKKMVCKLWQWNYYEHVVRDDAELQRITNYIKYNVTNWARDKYYINEAGSPIQ
jgi:putative transposase